MMTVKEKVLKSLDENGIAILPPMDVFESTNLLRESKIFPKTTMLDPWYNKGYGGKI